MNPATTKRAVWMILAAGLVAAGCGGDVKKAVLSIQPGDNLPCLGVRRIKVTVFKDEVSLQHRADADALLFAQLPHRGDAIPGAVGTLLNEFGHAAGEPFVQIGALCS